MGCSDLLQILSSSNPGEFFKERIILKTAPIEIINITDITFQKCSTISAFYEYPILSEYQYDTTRIVILKLHFLSHLSILIV